ncbi:MAG: hypothetical protein QOH57_2625 [Mycobacterium sp.]|jgi:membrane-bound ClpP family serine protease|nr:hypothetical protein [Mycobacterium sp.]
MRGPGGIIGVVVVIWLVIGVIAAYQRDYFKSGAQNCASAGTIALTVIVGPLNYFGVNPKVTDCNIDKAKLPQPSQ